MFETLVRFRFVGVVARKQRARVEDAWERAVFRAALHATARETSASDVEPVHFLVQDEVDKISSEIVDFIVDIVS